MSFEVTLGMADGPSAFAESVYGDRAAVRFFPTSWLVMLGSPEPWNLSTWHGLVTIT